MTVESDGKQNRVQGWRLVLCTLSLMGLFGCTLLEERSREELEAAFGSRAPRIEATHAARTIPPRSDWRIYLRVTDPDGDLHFIETFIQVPWGGTPARLKVEQEQGRLLSGYLLFDTLRFVKFSPLWVRLNLFVEDRAGHRTGPLEFTATFSTTAEPGEPPQGVFQERLLGRLPTESIPDAIGPGI